ncbi:ester cyclase [Streptomyces barringtoniae]|uniref:ester cyclase n=1 Tax=Streptomyces barringtoniae TaxID=2892029 RepID=UPI001E2D4204|nr:ester cyclase [Streptomyces barringtoniae]MCC5479477.1 ester cyclase [Streptomyces barringtoniae]
MSQQTNIAAQTAFGEAVVTGDLDALEEIVAPGSIDHDPAPGQAPGPEGYKTMFGELRTAFPDLRIAVDHLVATDEEVAFAYTVSGTHLGPLMGHRATGRKVSYRGMQISRFDGDGRLVERWGSSDELGMLRQLGLAEAGPTSGRPSHVW